MDEYLLDALECDNFNMADTYAEMMEEMEKIEKDAEDREYNDWHQNLLVHFEQPAGNTLHF